MTKQQSIKTKPSHIHFIDPLIVKNNELLKNASLLLALVVNIYEIEIDSNNDSIELLGGEIVYIKPYNHACTFYLDKDRNCWIEYENSIGDIHEFELWKSNLEYHILDIESITQIEHGIDDIDTWVSSIEEEIENEETDESFDN